MKIFLTVIYIIFTTLGLTMFKLGGNSFTISFKNGFSFNMGYLTLLGFIFYLASFLLWQKLLGTFDLSYIVPITTGIVQVIIILIGWLFFKEKLMVQNLIGIIFVIVGIILISIKK